MYIAGLKIYHTFSRACVVLLCIENNWYVIKIISVKVCVSFNLSSFYICDQSLIPSLFLTMYNYDNDDNNNNNNNNNINNDNPYP